MMSKVRYLSGVCHPSGALLTGGYDKSALAGELMPRTEKLCLAEPSRAFWGGTPIASRTHASRMWECAGADGRGSNNDG